MQLCFQLTIDPFDKIDRSPLQIPQNNKVPFNIELSTVFLTLALSLCVPETRFLTDVFLCDLYCGEALYLIDVCRWWSRVLKLVQQLERK